MSAFVRLMAITIQQRLYYKAGFLMTLTTPLILLGSQLLLWSAVYGGGREAVGTLSRPDMFSYLLMAFLINSLLTFGSENELSREIRSGTVSARRMRPVRFVRQTLASMCGNMALQAVVNVSVVGLAFLAFRRHLTLPSPSVMPAFLLSLALGMMVRMMLVATFSLLCFYTTGHLGLTWTRTALTEFFSGAMIPVALFPGWLMSLTYATPFPLMLQVPVAVFLGQPLPVPLWATFLMQAAWALILWVLHEALYGHIQKNATMAGG